MRVSVLVPVHDQAHFLGRALASLRDQAYADWEAVVLDDGSRDDPAAVAAPYLQDPRVRLLGWVGNRGLGATLNAGLDATDGEVVAYLPAAGAARPAADRGPRRGGPPHAVTSRRARLGPGGGMCP